MPTIPAPCAQLATQLENVREVERELFAEYQAATGRERSRLFHLWRQSRQEAGRLTAALDRCLNPPPPKPDLVPILVRPVPKPGGRLFDLAAVLENQGAGEAHGPFVVTLGVEYASFTQDPPLRIYREAMIHVASGITIAPGASFTTDTMKDIPINKRPGSQMPPLFDIHVLADANAQVGESAEGNNYLQLLGARLEGIG